MSRVFVNPVLRGFNPDPSIARRGDDFFLTTSTFEYFPGLPIYHSKDLLNWKIIGHALNRRSQLEMRTVEPGAGIWAPTLRWRKDRGDQNGRFYLATCKWDRYRPKTDERIFPRGFCIYTDDIWDDNAWSEPIYFDNPGFDQDLFWDDDGTVYLSTTMRLANRPVESKEKDFAIHISQVDIDTGRTLSAPKVIRTSPHGIAEGSHIIKRGTFYYLFTAEGGTESGHQEWVLRKVQNTGHVDVFEDAKGHWWAVLLGVRPRKVGGRWEESPLGRETFLVRVHWENDWPVFNYGNNISLQTTVSDGLMDDACVPSYSNPKKWKANFDRDRLELGWFYKNTPLKSFYSLGEVPGSLRLYGGCYSLSSPEAPTMLLQKQTAINQNFTVSLIFRQKKAGYEAGIVVWWSMYSYATIGVTIKDDKLHAVSRGLRTPLFGRWLEGGPDVVFNTALEEHYHQYELLIEARAESYILHFQPNTKHAIKARPVLVSELISSPSVGGAFTGMMFGLYAFGNGEPCLDPADFSNVSIDTLEN